jgi:hypothetical protein
MEVTTLFRSSIATMVLAMFAIPSFAQQPAAPPLPESAAATEQQPTNAPAPPSDLLVIDQPLDGGKKAKVTFKLSPDDQKDTDPKKVLHYVVLAAGEYGGHYREVLTSLIPEEKNYRSGMMTGIVEGLVREEAYFFRVRAIGPGGVESDYLETKETEVIHPSRQWFDGGRIWMAVITLIICGSVVWFIGHARKGKPLNIRKIAGLEAVEEAVGRATEMGRSCLFIPGIQDMNDIQTIAGLTVLSRVAEVAAEYGAKVEVPTCRSLVMTAASETVEASYLSAGRPDEFNEDDIYYVTDEQFGYVAYLSGMMVREKPAACFYMGSFFAESLILAETGNSIGAIQVAGTAQPSQLPFFVAACDYTLIGEEFFAASAYLSGDPDQLGSLKGQDVGKLIVAVLLIIGCATATLAGLYEEVEWFGQVTDYLKETVLKSGS